MRNREIERPRPPDVTRLDPPGGRPGPGSAPCDAPGGAGTASPPLQLVLGLAAALDASGIGYCQFKSNRHLEAGLAGLTDLDVLVERQRHRELAIVLAHSGFKRFAAPPGGDYPGVEDYLAMDADTGRLAHLHLHHQLTTGATHLKGHRIPWEEEMLATRVRHGSGFAIADPSLELLFLLTRSTLKIRARDRVRSWFGHDDVHDALDPEFRWLLERGERARVVALADDLLGGAAAVEIGKLLASGPTLRRMMGLRHAVAPTLGELRIYHPAGGWLHRASRQLRSLGARIGRRFPRLAPATSRTDPRGGLLVAFVGPDGSGKTRLASDVAAWLGWKLDARVTYFGSGEGPSSLGRRPLQALLSLARSLRIVRPSPTRASGSANGGRRRRRAVEAPARAVWALVLAREKRSKLQRAWRSRNRGIIVICDRYPQDQVTGFNDGPLLHGWRDSRIVAARALSRWEALPYAWAHQHAPDVVIKLRVSPDVAVLRKPDMHPAEIARRNRALSALRFPAGTRVVELDADRPWEEVLLDCQREIWDAL